MTSQRFGLAVFWALSLACASPSTGDAWPWKQWCHGQSPKTYNMCPTQSRNDLPTVAPGGEYEITWLRRVIAETDPKEKKISTDAKFWHSAILIQDKGSAMTMLVQYEALNFDASIFFPTVSKDRKIAWNNTAVVGWIPSVNHSEWQTSVTMGVVNGNVLNKWFDWVPGFGARQPGYTLFSVWDRAGMFPAVRTEFESVRDSCCHRFTEDGLSAFHAAGADFSSMQSPLCRNYFVLIKDTFRPVTKVDRSNADEWGKVVDYYEDWHHLIHNVSSVAEWTKDFVEMSLKYTLTSYVADSDLSNYHIVHLSMPYFTYLLQRMKLPWQNGGTPTECWSEEDLQQAVVTSMPVVV